MTGASHWHHTQPSSLPSRTCAGWLVMTLASDGCCCCCGGQECRLRTVLKMLMTIGSKWNSELRLYVGGGQSRAYEGLNQLLMR